MSTHSLPPAVDLPDLWSLSVFDLARKVAQGHLTIDGCNTVLQAALAVHLSQHEDESTRHTAYASLRELLPLCGWNAGEVDLMTQALCEPRLRKLS